MKTYLREIVLRDFEFEIGQKVRSLKGLSMINLEIGMVGTITWRLKQSKNCSTSYIVDFDINGSVREQWMLEKSLELCS